MVDLEGGYYLVLFQSKRIKKGCLIGAMVDNGKLSYCCNMATEFPAIV